MIPVTKELVDNLKKFVTVANDQIRLYEAAGGGDTEPCLVLKEHLKFVGGILLQLENAQSYTAIAERNSIAEIHKIHGVPFYMH